MTQYSWKNDRVEGLLITIIFEHMRNCIFFFMLVLLYQKINLIGFWDAQLLREHIWFFILAELTHSIRLKQKWTNRMWSNGYPLLIKAHSWKNNCHSPGTFKPKYIGILWRKKCSSLSTVPEYLNMASE